MCRFFLNLTLVGMLLTIPLVQAAENTPNPLSDRNSQLRTYTVSEKEVLQVSLPQSWKDSIRSGQNDQKEIMMGIPGDNTFLILLQIKGNNGLEFDHPDFVRIFLNQLKKTMKGKEADPEVTLTGISGPESNGFYYSMEIPPREETPIRFLTRGAVKSGKLLLTFTILTTDGKSAYLKTGLDVIRSAKYRVQPSAAGSPENITIQTTESSYVLTVPVSRLIMAIPKGNLALKNNAVGGGTSSPRYFYFEDSKLDLIISGWFESAQGFSGIKKFWEEQTNGWKQMGLPPAQKVSFSKIGNWETITYETAPPRGTNLHIRAHWVQAGTWIDIHLSLTSDLTSAESQKILESLLRTISIKEKG